jgi:hypothetical protein
MMSLDVIYQVCGWEQKTKEHQLYFCTCIERVTFRLATVIRKIIIGRTPAICDNK